MVTPFSASAVAFVQGSLAVLLALAVCLLLIGRHDRRATLLWSGGGMIGGLAALLVSVRTTLPGWVDVGGIVALAVSGLLLRTAALYRELGRAVPWRPMAAFLVVAVAWYAAADAAMLDMRTLSGRLIRGMASTWLGVMAWRLHRRDASRSAALIGGASLLLAGAYLVNALYLLPAWGTNRPSEPKDYQLIICASVLATMFTHVGYVGLAWERARARERARTAELAHQHARFVELEGHLREMDMARAQRQQGLHEAVPAMMHSIDANGRLVAVSDTWLDKLGYTRAEVIGRPSTDLLTPRSRDHARNVVLPAFFRDGRCDNIAYEMVRRDGRVIEVRLSAVLERDPAGQPLRSLAVIEDVSDLQREQAQRQQAEQQAAVLNRLLDERNEMLRVLAHEVRQPLNNASAALQGAAAALAGGDAAAQYPIRRAQAVLTEVLTGLDNTLAEAALLAAGEAHCQDCDVETVLAIAIADMAPSLRERVQVDRSTAPRTAAMDPALMRLALRNVLANALAYSPPASAVTVRVLDGDAPLSLIFEVENTGPRIAPEVAERLFQRGVRGTPRGPDRSGNGLGLYIVGRVMQLHRGTAALVRNEDDAVVFRLVVPQALALPSGRL